jgi:poly(A) polymerase
MRRGKRPLRLLTHPRFRAAYDFLLLRAAVGEAEGELAEWWTKIQEAEESVQAIAPDASSEPVKRKRKRRRRRPKATTE